MKFLRFNKHEDSHYIITDRNGNALGTVEKGELFSGRMVFTSIDIVEWTAKCLREVADFIDSLKSKERRKTVRPKRAAQQPQAKMAACYRAKQCSSYIVYYCGENALKSRRFACYRSKPPRSAVR